MLCNLIYNRPEAEPNKNYIDFYRRACTRRGVDFLVLYKEDLDAGITPLPSDGFVINRTRDLALALALEGKGLPVFNNSRITLLGNDKLAALHYIEECHLPILKTSEDLRDLDRFPVVMKSRDGHGGTEVFLLKHPEEAPALQQMRHRPPQQTPTLSLRSAGSTRKSPTPPGRICASMLPATGSLPLCCAVPIPTFAAISA